MPDPSEYLLPPDTSLWADDYAAAGGRTFQETMAYSDADQAAQNYDPFGYSNAPQAAPEQQWMSPDDYVSWPAYQGMVGGNLPPHEAYDKYVNILMPSQLRQMGYSPEEVQAYQQQFSQKVPPPDADFGFFGNLWETVKSGAKSGTRAEAATGNLVQGDLDDIAKLVTEQATGARPNAPLRRFQNEISTPEAQSGFWDAVKAYAGAVVHEPQGALNFLAEQTAQSYPSIAGGAGGALAGSLAGPWGALIGGMVGVGTGSASVEVGSQILERIATEAQARGIDPRNTVAIRNMINDPEVYASLRNAALAKGLTVGAADAAVSAFSLGMGKVASNALKAGRGLRATGIGAGGVLGESLGSAGGEALSQKVAGDKLNYSDVVGEFFGDFGPGAAHVLTGALIPSQQQATPGNAPLPGEGIDESDLPGGGEGVFQGGIDVTEIPTENIEIPPVGPREPLGVGTNAIDVTEPGVEDITIGDIPNEPPPGGGGISVERLPVEEITLRPVQATDSAELRIRDGRLLPLFANPPLVAGPAGVGTPAQQEALRLQGITTPQSADFTPNDPDVLVQWLADRGVDLVSEEQRAIVADLVGTRPNDRQAFIADAIDGLASSTEAGAEPLAQALLAISRSIPRERNTRARAQVALEAALPGVPGAEIPKVVASEAAQKVMADLAAGVTNAVPTTQPTAATPGTITVGEAVAPDLNVVDADTPVVHGRRGLKRGEPIPTSTGLGAIANQLLGSGVTSGNEAPVQQSGGGLRAGVNQEGAGGGGRRGTLRGGQAGAAGRDTGRAGTQPFGAAGTRGVSGVAPPIKVELSTTPTERRYGTQAEDTANKEAERAAREDAKAKKATRGLSKKARANAKNKLKALSRQGAIDAVTMDKEEYEAKYPGRDFDADTDALVKTTTDKLTGSLDNPEDRTRISDQDLLAMQHMDTETLMNNMAARAKNPILRAVALEIGALSNEVPFRLQYLQSDAGYHTIRTRGEGVVDQVVVVDPRRASVETILHEYVHAATVWAYETSKDPAHQAAAKQMDALFEVVKANTGLTKSEFYGLTNTKEFISEALTNPAFQEFLGKLPMPGAPKISVWTAFKRIVMNILGRNNQMDTVLAHVLANVESLFAAGPRVAGTPLSVSKAAMAGPPASNGAANAVPSSAIVGTKANARTFIAYAKDKTNPNTTYTVYPVTPQYYKGDPAGKLAGLSRDQVERHIKAAGSEVVPPASDTSVASGTPKNTTTKRVGYDHNGNLQAAAFEQKDGTWTYYESDDDVRTDPDARVSKGLSKDAVQRFITARGLAAEPPKGGTVKPDGSKPTSVGYKPANWARRTFQDDEGTLINIGGTTEEAATLRNSRVEAKLKQIDRQYIEPVRKAGNQITTQFGKTEDEIFALMQDLHVVERMQTKMQQFYRGNLSPGEQQVKQQDLFDKQKAAQDRVNAARGSNPAYVRAVEQELAPKLKAMADNTIDMNAQYGFLERGEAENIKAAYDFYVPLQKDDKRTTVGKAATGASVTGDLTFPRMVEQASRTVVRGEQNRVRGEVLKLAERNLLVNKETGESPVVIGPKQVIRYNKDTNSLNTGEDSFVFDRDAIDVYRNGERIRMKITDPSLLEALHPYTGKERPAFITAAIAALAQVMRVISIGKTSLNPAWPPFNFVRDVLTSNINLPAGVSRARYLLELAKPSNYASVLWNVGKEAIGKDPAGGYADAKDAGAFISHRAFIGLDPIAHSVQAMFKPPLMKFDKQHLYGLSQKGTLVGKAGAKLFEALSVYPQWAESVPRMAMYKAAIASGMSREKAAMAAKNASVNFERRGKVPLSNYWIFANAKMQGVHALLKTAERMGTLKATMGAASIIALGAVAAAMGYEWSEKDKDGKSKYTKIPDFRKDSLILFKADAPGIPIPQEVTPFYVLGNAGVEAIMGGVTAGKAAARVFTAALNNIHPGSVAQQDPVGHNANVADFITRMFVPSIGSPMYDTATNKNTFGRPVVSKLEERKAQGIPKSEMGSPNENQLAVNVAKGLYQATDGNVDVAPQQIKLWNNFFNPAAEGVGFFNDLFGGREPKYVGEEVNPFVRKFMGNATEFYDQEQFDELLAKAKRAKYLAEQPGHGGFAALSDEDKVLARSAQMLQKVESDGNALFKGQKLMTPERRKLLNERKRDLVLGGIRRYNEMRDQTIRKQ